MNITVNDLSFWEQKLLFNSVDFLVVGAGIVGMSCAYHLKIIHPNAKVLVIDKGILPFSASSKNAGFACFGSPSEILSDLRTMESSKVWETVKKRWDGLNALKMWLGNKTIDLQEKGSWDLIQSKNQSDEISEKLSDFNSELLKISGIPNVYSEDKHAISQFGFQGLYSAFNNKLEGQIDTSLLNLALIKKVTEKDILILRGIEVLSYSTEANCVKIDSNIGAFSCTSLILCTNGFAKNLEPNLDVEPARAQVMVTNKIENLKFSGTFHFDEGYYYFRNVDDRVLIGGGRNQNFTQENTDRIEISEDIQAAIENVLRTIVLPHTPFQIEQRWAGIMGVGQDKSPILKRLNSRVCVGVRMGGMGVAIGTLVGKELAELHS